MLCKSFENLTPLEKSIFIGKLCHLCQSDETYFKHGKKLIEKAENQGLFAGVTIMPMTESEIETTNT